MTATPLSLPLLVHFTRPPAAWRNRVLDRINTVGLQLAQSKDMALQAPPGPAREEMLRACATAEIRLTAAATAATNSPKQPIRTAWRGSDIDAAWMNTHAVEATLVKYTPDTAAYRSVLIEARQRSAEQLKPTDERLLKLKDADRVDADKQTLAAGSMALAAAALAAAFTASADEHRRVRDFRNILISTTVGAAALAMLLGVIGVLWPTAINLCWAGSGDTVYCPTGRATPTGGDVITVELLGLLGAAVVTALAVRRLRGTSTPYAVPMLSLLVKLPIGALTAPLALLLLHLITSFTVTSQYQLAGYALIFGASQQAFTRLIDRQAQNVLDSVPESGKDAAKKPSS